MSGQASPIRGYSAANAAADTATASPFHSASHKEILNVVTKIKNRLASEQGFTLIELLIVIIILGILVAIAVPSYLSFRSKAETSAAEANVRSAIPAAESYYQGTGNGSYTGLTGATLRTEAPGIAATVKAGVSSGKYCIEDTEGGATYHYEGGTGGAATMATGGCTGYTVS